MLDRGQTIGILGGGQLGRMIAHAAALLGYRCHVFAPGATTSSAGQVAARTTDASWSDHAALDAFCETVAVCTLEWENIPEATLGHVAQRCELLPRPDTVALCTDRLAEKRFLNTVAATTAFARASSAAELGEALNRLGLQEAIAKASREGYDGKGQARVRQGDDMEAIWAELDCAQAIVEAVVDFRAEISVIVARDRQGQVAVLPVVENEHRHHVLAKSIVPARIAPEVSAEAQAQARRIAEASDLVGVMAIEMFVGRGGEILINELAPRPHNSGHWSIEGCASSQFDQLVRVLVGAELGSVDLLWHCEMHNLLGEAIVRDRDHWMAQARAQLHDYGKEPARPGRKMGHVTVLGDSAGGE